MKAPASHERGWRGSADLWLDAAYHLLVEGGVEAVKVMPLAEKLGLSRTSFYWHFADREALLDGLIARWEHKNTANLIAQTQKTAQTIAEAALNLCDCWFMPDIFDDRLEFAIRTWALTDPQLERTLATADATRIAAIKAMFLRFGYPDELFSPSERAHGIHGGDIETSLMMAYRPDLVRDEECADFPSANAEMERSFTWLRAHHGVGFGWMSQDLSPSGAMGNAAIANVEKGEASADYGATAFLELLQDIEAFDLARLADGPLD